MPASVPVCAELHTGGTTLRAGIVLDGDLGCLADLLDDQKTAVSLDHARDVQVLVAREDQKTPRVASDRFVPTVRDFQRLGAVFAAALADEADEEAVALAVTHHEAGGNLLHALVHLAEECFVVRPALLLRIHLHDSRTQRFLSRDRWAVPLRGTLSKQARGKRGRLPGRQ